MPGRSTAILMQRLRHLEMSNIATLRTFVTVVELGSFSKAARHLQLSPSTVSKHIETLENILQGGLLYRTTRRVSVTDAGYAFYERCQAILTELSEGLDHFSGNPDVLEGRLRVTATPSFTASLISPRLPDFLSRHPDLLVDLRVTTDSLDLVREGIDLAVRLGNRPQKETAAIKLAANRCVVCASPDYFARHGIPGSPEDLSHHSCLIGVGSPFAEQWPFCIRGVLTSVRVTGCFSTNDGEVLRSACINGIGLGGFYAFHVAEDLRTGRLQEVLRGFQGDVSSIYAVLPHRRHIAPKVQAFIDFLRDIIGGC